MFHSFREHFGPAGLVVAVVALIAALSGGAIAATGGNPFAGSSRATHKSGASASGGLTKKQVLALIREHAVPGAQGLPGVDGKDGTPGQDGAPGKEGAPGQDGANGENGEDGVDGANGVTGKSVLNGSGPPSNGLGTNGDFYIDTANNLLYGPKASNVWPPTGTSMKGEDGADGSPWTVGGTLPVNATETGGWTYTSPASAEPFLIIERGPLISFPIPLAAALNSSHVAFQGAPQCSGSIAHPTAASGYLCIYGTEYGEAWEGIGSQKLSSNTEGADTAGMQFSLFIFPETTIRGTWAVTG
jgi:Collagen triple helix repeat (20 copies)